MDVSWVDIFLYVLLFVVILFMVYKMLLKFNLSVIRGGTEGRTDECDNCANGVTHYYNKASENYLKLLRLKQDNKENVNDNEIKKNINDFYINKSNTERKYYELQQCSDDFSHRVINPDNSQPTHKYNHYYDNSIKKAEEYIKKLENMRESMNL